MKRKLSPSVGKLFPYEISTEKDRVYVKKTDSERIYKKEGNKLECTTCGTTVLWVNLSYIIPLNDLLYTNSMNQIGSKYTEQVPYCPKCEKEFRNGLEKKKEEGCFVIEGKDSSYIK